MKTNHFILQFLLLIAVLASTSLTINAQQRKTVTNRKTVTAKKTAIDNKDIITGDTVLYKGEVLFSNYCFFSVGRTNINKSDTYVIEGFARYAKEHPDCRILLEGFAFDNELPGDYRQARLDLSLRRVANVRKELIENYQIDKKRIIAKAFGDRILFDDMFNGWVLLSAIPSSDTTHDQVIVDGMNYRITGLKTAAVARNEKASGDVTIADTLTVKGKQYVVTSIVDDAFRHCEWLNSVHIPRTVAFVGRWAFNNCTRLKTVFLQKDGLEAFKKIVFADKYGNALMNPEVQICEILGTTILAPDVTRDDELPGNEGDAATLSEDPKKSVVHFNGGSFELKCHLDIPDSPKAQQYVAELLFGEKEDRLGKAYSNFLIRWNHEDVFLWKPVKGEININVRKEYEMSGRFACYHVVASLNGGVVLTGLPQNELAEKMKSQYFRLMNGIDHYFIVDIQNQNLVGMSQIFVPQVSNKLKTMFGNNISLYAEDRCLQVLSKKGDGRFLFNKKSEANFTEYFRKLVGWGETKNYDTPDFFRGQKGLEDYLRDSKFILAPEDEEFDTVKVSLVVLEDGSPQQPKIESKSIYCPKKKLLEICEQMPKWKPAYKDGEPIAKEVSFSIKVPKWFDSVNKMPSYRVSGFTRLVKLG